MSKIGALRDLLFALLQEQLLAAAPKSESSHCSHEKASWSWAEGRTEKATGAVILVSLWPRKSAPRRLLAT
jgi:hypothetical protein